VKVLIAYRSKYGATAGCAAALAGRLGAETVLFDLATRGAPKVESFDAVLIGGSIYGGKIQGAVTSFCENHERVLVNRPVGVFVCCFFQGEQARAQIQASFPEWLLAHSFASVHCGAVLHYRRLTVLDRFLVRSLGSSTGDLELIRQDAIAGLADSVKALASP
jgi:menaquinone-dependent protoporphyrinogen oxidase